MWGFLGGLVAKVFLGLLDRLGIFISPERRLGRKEADEDNRKKSDEAEKRKARVKPAGQRDHSKRLRRGDF